MSVVGSVTRIKSGQMFLKHRIVNQPVISPGSGIQVIQLHSCVLVLCLV